MPELEMTLQRQELRVTLFKSTELDSFNPDGSRQLRWSRFRVRASRRDRSPRVERYFDVGVDVNWSRTYTCSYSEADMGEITTSWVLAEGWYENYDEVPTNKRFNIVGIQHPFFRGEDDYIVLGVE